MASIKSGISNDGITANVQIMFTNSDISEPFYLRELGLYCYNSATDETILFGYAYAIEPADYVMDYASVPTICTFNLQISVSNASEVTCIFPENSYITFAQLDAEKVAIYNELTLVNNKYDALITSGNISPSFWTGGNTVETATTNITSSFTPFNCTFYKVGKLAAVNIAGTLNNGSNSFPVFVKLNNSALYPATYTPGKINASSPAPGYTWGCPLMIPNAIISFPLYNNTTGVEVQAQPVNFGSNYFFMQFTYTTN